MLTLGWRMLTWSIRGGGEDVNLIPIYDLCFFDKSTRFEKTGSMSKTFISLGNLIIKLHLQNYEPIRFFMTFTFFAVH